MWFWSRKLKDWRFNVNLTSIKCLSAFLLLFKKRRRKKYFTDYSIKRNFTAAVHPTFYGGTIWGDNTTTMWHHNTTPKVAKVGKWKWGKYLSSGNLHLTTRNIYANISIQSCHQSESISWSGFRLHYLVKGSVILIWP